MLLTHTCRGSLLTGSGLTFELKRLRILGDEMAQYMVYAENRLMEQAEEHR